MRVLLLQDVKGVGQKMDVKEVNDGYARNFLIPRKLAVMADQSALKIKTETEKQAKNLISQYENLSDKLAKEILEFSIKAGEKNQTFGSVDKEQINKVLLEKNLIKADSEVLLDKPLKSLGEHWVEIKLGRGIRGKIKVILKPQQ